MHPPTATIIAVLLLTGVAVAGCTAPSQDPTDPVGAEPTPSPKSPPPASPPPASEPSSTTTTAFTVRVQEGGFNGDPNLRLVVNEGDRVRVTFVHDEPYGDFHPISFACNGKLANVTPDGGPQVVEFVAEEKGACGFSCGNHDCAIHGNLVGGQVVVEA